MPPAHLIHGYIGAGKTTLARRLEQEHRAVRFSHDEWMAALYGRDPALDQFDSHATRVPSLIEVCWRRCLSLGMDVVLDLGLWRRAERDRVRSVVQRLGAESRLYHLHCSEDEARRRINHRRNYPFRKGMRHGYYRRRQAGKEGASQRSLG